MQVFKTFFKVLFQQKRTMIVYLIVFLVLEVVMASMGAEDAKSVYTQKSYNIAVFDEDNTDLSQSLTDYLGTENVLIECEDDPEMLLDQLYARDIVAYIRIPSGCQDLLKSKNAENIIEIHSIPGTIYESVISSQINQYMACINSYLASGSSIRDAIDKTDDTMAIPAKVTLHGNYANGQKSTLYYFFAYIPYLLTCVSLVGLGACLISFNKKEIKDRMESSSLPLMKKNISLLGSSIVAELAVAGIFLLLGVLMYREKMFTTQGLLLIVNTLCFSTVSLSITYLISLFAKDINVLNLLGNTIGLAMSFLGGIFVSLDLFSETMINIAHFMPTYWFVTACELIERNSPVSAVTSQLTSCYLIQLVFAAAIIAVTLIASKMQTQNK